MQDRDADGAVSINVGMPHGRDELHLGREQRIFWWEYQLCAKKSAFVERIVGANDHNLPFEQITFVLETGAKTIDGTFAKLGELSFEEEGVARGGRCHCGWLVV